jgi:hypothetical protein
MEEDHGVGVVAGATSGGHELGFHVVDRVRRTRHGFRSPDLTALVFVD